MSPRHPLSAYRTLDDAEVREMLWLAIHLHLHRLPQLKGKGKIIHPDARSDAARTLASAVADQLALSDVLILKGPPVAQHGGGYG
jgi:hypothetical protein